MIMISKVSKTYNGKVKAVDEIDLEIRDGEIFGFLGPNGAGKTTTINMLTGLARPTSGSIHIAGQDGVKNIKKVQQLIGIVPDESNLYEEMSGFDNLTFCASLYGMNKIKRETRARQLLDQFGLGDTGKKPFKAYSKGMKRKLAIAAGIIHEPEILFLDEPTTGIDVESARQIRRLISTLNSAGTTIFLTTHYIEEAERLCHRIGFIVDGRIIQIGKTADLIQEAQQESVVEFSFENSQESVLESLKDSFPEGRATAVGNSIIRISSAEKINLIPFMKIFEANNIQVNEAKIIKPSLEEIFVKVTGIELEKMKKEREGGKK